jgi:hypothetical protein
VCVCHAADPTVSSAAWCRLADNPHISNSDSLAVLKEARNRFPISAHTGFPERAAHHEFKRALLCNNLDRAHRISREIFTFAPSTFADSFQTTMESAFVHAQLKFIDGQAKEAFTDATRMISVCESRKEHVLAARLLLFVARIHETSGEFTSALPYVLKCLSLCHNLHMDNLECEAKIALAKLHLQLGSPLQGIKSLQEIIPHTLENCEPRVQVELFLALAKCLLKLYGVTKADNADRGSNSSKSLEHHVLRQIIECLHTARHRAVRAQYSTALEEVYYLLARAYHETHDIENRNKASEHFLRIKSQRRSSAHKT